MGRRMFDADARMVKKLPWLVFFAMTFAGAFKISGFPYYWCLYFVCSLCMLLVTFYLAYMCERYTNFVLITLCASSYSLVYLLSSLSYLLLKKNLGFGMIEAVMVGMGPMLVIGAVFVLIYFTKSSFLPFEITGRRVAARGFKVKENGGLFGVFIGITTLAGGFFMKSVGSFNGGVVSIVLGTVIWVFLLVRLRHIIRGIRTLRLQERGMPIPYTFMRIDEIREARSRWWMGRLLKWVGTLRTSA